jgi:heptaprenyl diphosphate synthase
MFMKKRASLAKKLATLSIFTALSLIVFLIENLFPPLIIPGAKMGLSNIFSLIALIMYSPVEAFIIVAVRTLLGALFAGNISAIMYSFTGGMVAMAVSSILLYTAYPKVSLMSISIVAAIAHNITQNVVFVLISETPLMFYYMPYLALIGILSGCIVGGAVMLIFKRVPLSVYEKAILR